MIYTLGESLMDIIITHDGQTVAKPGGSMLNVAVSLGRSQHAVSHISEIGNDELGRMLTRFLNENGVQTSLMKKYAGSKTALAIAALDKQKKPSYTFCKTYPEQRSLGTCPDFRIQDVLVLGSMYSRDVQIKTDIDRFLQSAKRGGALVVYDPNMRQNHKSDNRGMLMKNLSSAHIIKGSDEDFQIIFGTGRVGEIKAELRKINPQALLIVTLGEKGSVAFYGDRKLESKALKTEVVSTIGAGDAFTAGVVHAVVTRGLVKKVADLQEDDVRMILEEATRFASAVCGTIENYIPVKEV